MPITKITTYMFILTECLPRLWRKGFYIRSMKESMQVYTIHKTFTRAKYFLVYRITPVMMSSGHIHGHVIVSGKMLRLPSLHITVLTVFEI